MWLVEGKLEWGAIYSFIYLFHYHCLETLILEPVLVQVVSFMFSLSFLIRQMRVLKFIKKFKYGKDLISLVIIEIQFNPLSHHFCFCQLEQQEHIEDNA